MTSSCAGLRQASLIATGQLEETRKGEFEFGAVEVEKPIPSPASFLRKYASASVALGSRSVEVYATVNSRRICEAPGLSSKCIVRPSLRRAI